MILVIGFRWGKKVNENLGVENREVENMGVSQLIPLLKQNLRKKTIVFDK